LTDGSIDYSSIHPPWRSALKRDGRGKDGRGKRVVRERKEENYWVR
jgi:hypothetical protein